MTRALEPGVVLMDLTMPRLGGLEATRRIRALSPRVPVVILTSSDSEAAMEAVRGGARGYLLKSVAPRALLEALRGVARGEVCVSPAMAARLLAELPMRGAGSAVVRRSALAPRESEVLALVAEGRTSEEIASALDVTESAVRGHLERIVEKMRLESRARGALRALSRTTRAATAEESSH
jgi:NarL family two-component system response regulator LiaR